MQQMDYKMTIGKNQRNLKKLYRRSKMITNSESVKIKGTLGKKRAWRTYIRQRNVEVYDNYETETRMAKEEVKTAQANEWEDFGSKKRTANQSRNYFIGFLKI